MDFGESIRIGLNIHGLDATVGEGGSMEIWYTRQCCTGIGTGWSSADYGTVVSAAGLVRGLQVRTEAQNGKIAPRLLTGYPRSCRGMLFMMFLRREVSDLGALNRSLLWHGEAGRNCL